MNALSSIWICRDTWKTKIGTGKLFTYLLFYYFHYFIWDRDRRDKYELEIKQKWCCYNSTTTTVNWIQKQREGERACVGSKDIKGLIDFGILWDSGERVKEIDWSCTGCSLTKKDSILCTCHQVRVRYGPPLSILPTLSFKIANFWRW